ncbi:hypothetical protein [Salmonella enterica]|uniref:Uncharacterized protein n=1 Tax=Salmonella enterica subsp. enterica serovar Dessau TaxID=2564349 RepID=A0A8E5IMI4_SALET|nr:hypothetical protein [Salmonella enterica]QUS47087.1 hypothetical protein F1331_25935 [Salmonella enterica subsp. enterica serovar Dessau]
MITSMEIGSPISVIYATLSQTFFSARKSRPEAAGAPYSMAGKGDFRRSRLGSAARHQDLPIMCRLLGIVASELTEFGLVLTEAPRCLATLSREHPDGWGIATADASSRDAASMSAALVDRGRAAPRPKNARAPPPPLSLSLPLPPVAASARACVNGGSRSRSTSRGAAPAAASASVVVRTRRTNDAAFCALAHRPSSSASIGHTETGTAASRSARATADRGLLRRGSVVRVAELELPRPERLGRALHPHHADGRQVPAVLVLLRVLDELFQGGFERHPT